MIFIIGAILGLIAIFLIIAHLYGIVLSFKRSVLLGCLSLFLPFMATIVGIVALVCNKNLLQGRLV